ncbi:magnesium/cobalt transporter CorA [Weeksellaceae bacterium TAE3-ERU29]|nr:magnesium/cobalt transporter CorA [Weeksellaceae bacterium TAE3-ERU29]
MGKPLKQRRKRISRAKKLGLPPGALVYMGEQENTDGFRIEVYSYDENDCFVQIFTKTEEALNTLKKDRYTWLNVTGLSNIKEVAKLGKFTSINNLFLEDILDTQHRSKVEFMTNNILLIIKMLYFKEDETIRKEHLAFILGENYLITFQENKKDIFNEIRKRLNEKDSFLRKKGIDYLFFSLMDAVVDNFFIVLEKLTEKVEDFEDQIIESPQESMISSIQDMKREAMSIRRSIYPLREVISRLEKTTHPIITADTSLYFQDLYDHIIHVIENLDIYTEMLLGLMDMYMSSVSNRMNSIMKTLTIISTVFIPLTFIVGVYGMNFKYMSFLNNPYGYPITWAVMIAMAVAMIFYYKKKKWL